MNTKLIKPVVGNLVVIDPQELPMDAREMANEYRFDNPGIIIECVGVRCVVYWPDGARTRPYRSILKVLS